jgi:L-ribulose-5-phosphate 4-epimerase
MNKELPRQKLVVWTGGNVSGLAPEAGHMVIKPSGVSFEGLTPESLVVVDLEGRMVEGDYKPSVDAGIHAYVYKHRPDIGGICHTHSPYCSSFALLEEPIPAATTPLGHLLGRDVPCTGYAKAGDVDTGRAIIETIGDGMAVLVKRHGVFTLGSTPTESVKIACYLEEAAQTIHYAMLRGTVTAIPQAELERCYDFYKAEYGQKS